MEKQYIGTPVTIHLANMATSINMDDLATQAFHPLMRDIHEKLTRHGLKFCLPLYLQHQHDIRRIDFRYALLDGLLPDTLGDENCCGHIRRALQAAQNEAMAQLESNLNKMTINDQAVAQRVLAEQREALKAKGNEYPLSEFHMAAFVREALPARIWQWLDDDIAAGRLTVADVRGHEAILIDDLVRWATGRKIVVEQDALPGCESLVAASYRCLHQQLSEVAMLARPAALTPTASNLVPNVKLTRNDGRIPGTIPRTENGKLAVELAWNIESAQNRRATAKEVMTSLMEMATKGDRPDILRARGADGRSVEWVTSKGNPKNYSTEAVGKTLEVWHASRQDDSERIR